MDLTKLNQYAMAMMQGVRRHDASSSPASFVENELKQILAQTYDREYPEMDAREHVPVSTQVNPGAMAWAYDSFQRAGQAKWIGQNPTDIPRVDVGKVRNTFPVHPFAIGYGWTVFELLNAQFTGVPVDAKKAEAAREEAMRFEHDAILFGEDGLNLPGFLSNVAVPIVGVPNGDWLGAAAPADIIEDVNFLIDRPWLNSALVERTTAMLFPASHFRKLQTTQLPNTNTTLLNFLRDTNPEVREWRVLRELATAGAGGTPRVVAYNKSPSKLMAVVPQPYTTIDPEVNGMEVVVNGWASFGGTVFMYPTSACYGEGIGS